MDKRLTEMDTWYASHAQAWNDPDTVARNRLEAWALWGPLAIAALSLLWTLS